MKKILIISPNYQEDGCQEWINAANSRSPHKNNLTFDYISPESPISENVTLYDCLEIKDMLCRTELSGYEGLILIHGTEYIPFTSAALSLLLTHLKIPLVIITQNALLTPVSYTHLLQNRLYRSLHFRYCTGNEQRTAEPVYESQIHRR